MMQARRPIPRIGMRRLTAVSRFSRMARNPNTDVVTFLLTDRTPDAVLSLCRDVVGGIQNDDNPFGETKSMARQRRESDLSGGM